MDWEYIKILLIWLSAVNICAFILMGADKRRAVKGRWRISEKGLFLPVLLGGSIGGMLGMYLFRHKTKHWYFKLGFPIIFIVQFGLIYLFVIRK